MDQNDLRLILTLLSFTAFVGIVWWAWSGRQRQRFEEAAQLPFLDNDLPREVEILKAKEQA